MESSTRTGELEPASFERGDEPTPAHVATARADVTPAEVHRSIITAISQGCSACGAAMATDQRYCVECGERRGPARVPLTDRSAQGAREAPAAHHPRRQASLSINSTLIAGVGTLLLAMGIGVLIGRSGNGTTAKSPPAQIVTVAGAGTAAAGTTATQPASRPSAAPTTKSGNTKTTPTLKSTSKKSTTLPPTTVKVGSPGHGPGYQHGHFTGNFFGE